MDAFLRGDVATGMISADMSGNGEGWFRIQLGSLDQWIRLVPRPRHFGGRQWYFVCLVTSRLASVLWKPSGCAALTFSSPDAATLAHGLRITPAFLESRRRSRPGGGFFMPPQRPSGVAWWS
jgi:hypothetical protein